MWVTVYVALPIFIQYFHGHFRVVRVSAHLGGVDSDFCFLESLPRVPSGLRFQELPQNALSWRVIFWSLFCRDSWEYGHPAPRCSNESSRR